MKQFTWLSRCAVVGAVLVILSVVVRAQQADDLFDPITKNEQASGERSVLIAEREAARGAEAANFCQCVGESDSEAVARIEQVLRAPLRATGLEALETPIEEVVATLSADYGIPIQLDIPALEEAALGPDEQVTITLHNISLRSALRLMLKSLGLTYIIQEEVLLITTPEEAESQLVTCVYDVSGLADDKDPQSTNALINAIMSCVARETWSINRGGVADIKPLKPGLLVVSQTRVVHEEVGGLLAAIRKMREQVPIPEAGPPEPEPAH